MKNQRKTTKNVKNLRFGAKQRLARTRFARKPSQATPEMVWSTIPVISCGQARFLSVSHSGHSYSRNVSAFGPMYWLLGRRIGFSATGWRPIGPGGTKTEAETLAECSPTTPATQGYSGGHLRARKPANQDATRTSAAPAEMYRLFFEGLSRDDTHFHQLAPKYKK